MSETNAELMSLGLTYWPRRAGFGWWRAYDRGETRDELAHVSALGCDTVRFCLRWEDFQPGPRRVNSAALHALEHALDAAGESGLRVVAALFPVALGAALQLPDWANGADPLDELRRATRITGPAIVIRPSGAPPVLYDDRYHTNQANDLFTDTRVLDAQRYLINELVGYFGAHPALHAWQLGEGLERVHKPASADAAHEWFALMVEAVRAARGGARVLGVVSDRALTTLAGPRPEQIAATCDLLGVAADPPRPPENQQPNHGTYVAFLHALTASLGRRPALVTSLGLPTVPGADLGANDADRPGWIADSAYGRGLRVFRGEPEQQAILVETTLDRLQQAGASGAWLAAYADYPESLWRRPPLDRAIRERTLGLVDASGREKPAAAALQRFAAERRPIRDIAPPLDADPERYWREPKREFARLWGEFGGESDES
ncbi:MAG TPA: hypothetical protein VFU22_03985 [Roseiflexaceae bacterium]|nr:hypothetical protein [Roseiflexaceae bacterium]